MIRILSWNIRQGGGSRILQIVKTIEQSEAPIITLNEFRNNASGIQLRTALLKLNYRYQTVTAAPANDNAVLIASKFPCHSRLFPKADEEFPHNIVQAEFDAFHLIGVYLPHKKKHKLFEFMTELIKKDHKPYVIAGDYNTGKNYIDQKGNSFWYTEELEHFEAAGMIDAFRHKQGDVKEYSWYSHQGNGFRYDQTYVEESLVALVTDCYYNHKVREDNISDHSAMVLELG